MKNPKVVVALFVLIAVLFVVGLGAGMARKDDPDQTPDAGPLAKFQGFFYGLTPRATFKQTTFHSGDEITDSEDVDPKKTPFRMVKFYLANPACSFEILYTPPKKDASLDKSGKPPRPVVLPAVPAGERPHVREGTVTLLGPGGVLHFKCTTNRPGHGPKTCMVTLSAEGK